MRFKVELVYVDSSNDQRDVSYFTYVEAPDLDSAIALAKQKQPIEQPELNPTDRWAWFAYQTHEWNKA